MSNIGICRAPMIFPELPSYIKVTKTVNKDTDTVEVEVESSIHKGGKVKLTPVYSIGYMNADRERFNSGVLMQIVRRYNLKPAPLRYE